MSSKISLGICCSRIDSFCALFEPFEPSLLFGSFLFCPDSVVEESPLLVGSAFFSSSFFLRMLIGSEFSGLFWPPRSPFWEELSRVGLKVTDFFWSGVAGLSGRLLKVRGVGKLVPCVYSGTSSGKSLMASIKY